MQASSNRRVAFTTLGCKVNAYDTEAVAELFRQHGYSIVGHDQPAEVYVINTCSVTNLGARKSRQAIRRAIRQNKDALVVAMGCYAQYAPDEVISIPGVSLVIGTHCRGEVVELVERALGASTPINAVQRIGDVDTYEELPALHFEGRTRAILKVQDGCNESCAFCQIPRARGRSRSRQPQVVIEQIAALVNRGFREIVLTGVHMGTYGLDLPGEVNLTSLLQKAAKVPGLTRLRISSIDPHEFSAELIDTIAEHKTICRHLHIPAQSGEDGVLAAMRRRHTTADFKELAHKLRAAIPGLAITTDVIVGFPGESEESFASTCQFCEEIAFSKVHVFPYSRRKGTIADRMSDHVPTQVKQERVQRLIAISDSLSLAYHCSLLNSELDVLLEEVTSVPTEQMHGLTETYVKVYMPGRQGVAIGDIVRVRASAATAQGIQACEEGRSLSSSNV